MKKKTVNLSRKLIFSKATISALNTLQQNGVLGGASVAEGCVEATHNRDCRTLGLAIDLTKCCQVYHLSVEIACEG